MVFISSGQLQNLANYKYNVQDDGILSNFYQPLWRFLLSYIPETIHPNMLTFCSFMCVLVGYRLSLSLGWDGLDDPALDNMQERPFWTICVIQLLINIYMHLDALDGKQARRLRCSSPIGELLDHALDNIGMIFALLTALNIWGVKSVTVTYLLIFVSSGLFLACHLDAYCSPKQIITFGKFTGPCESIMLYQLISFGGLWRKNMYTYHEDWCQKIAYLPYILLVVIIIYFIEKLYSFWNDKIKFPWVSGAALVFLLRAANAWYHMVEVGGPQNPVAVNAYLMEGLVLSCVTTEVIFSKMAKAPFSPVLFLLALIGWLSDSAGIAFSIIYYVQLFVNLSYSLNIPLFRLKRRVYMSGVFDMCHRGHMNLFKNALAYGDTIIVGVHNDMDVMSYKHHPVVNHDERVRTIELCKNVDEVIPNAPLIPTAEYIKENRIDVVLCSTEYDSPTDHWYKHPREMGILEVVGRTTGISSTELRTSASSPRATSSNDLAKLAKISEDVEDKAPVSKSSTSEDTTTTVRARRSKSKSRK